MTFSLRIISFFDLIAFSITSIAASLREDRQLLAWLGLSPAIDLEMIVFEVEPEKEVDFSLNLISYCLLFFFFIEEQVACSNHHKDAEKFFLLSLYWYTWFLHFLQFIQLTNQLVIRQTVHLTLSIVNLILMEGWSPKTKHILIVLIDWVRIALNRSHVLIMRQVHSAAA